MSTPDAMPAAPAPAAAGGKTEPAAPGASQAGVVRASTSLRIIAALAIIFTA